MRLLAACLALLLAARPAAAFDYYVLALSWQPTYCALEGADRHDPQCGTPRGFTLHGLWPQNETGYPKDCTTPERDPSRRETAAMADITGSAGLAWHEWKTHGRCSGLDARRYFALSRQAFGSIRMPPVLTALDRDVNVAPRVIEDAFREANPALGPDMVTITCQSGRIDEVRICMGKDLAPRDCGADAVTDCRLGAARLSPVSP